MRLVVLAASLALALGGALQPNPQLLSHRGSKLLCCENTVDCHRTALALGADIIELDVRSTKDGHIVVFHDRTTTRLCERAVRVADITLEELQQMDIGWRFSDDNGTTYPFRDRGFRVPTFVKLLNSMPSDTRISIELKDEGLLGLRTAAAVVDILRSANAFERVTVASEWCDIIQAVRRMAGPSLRTSACESEVSRFFLLSLTGLAVPWHRLVGAPAFQLLQIPTRSGPWVLATPELLSVCKTLGIEVQYWVVNSEEEAEALIDMGADAIITDRLDLLYPLMVKRGLRQPLAGPPSYYPARRRPGEVHKCVTLTCRVLSLPYSIRIITLLVLSLVATIVVQCRARRALAKRKKE